MGDRTEIQWADATWNPIRGCSRVSEGCRHCYAELVAARFSGPGQPYEGLARWVEGPRYRGGRLTFPAEPRWTNKVRLVEGALAKPLHWRRPRRIFVNSMSDLFHEKVPNEWIDRVLAVVALAQQHQFLVLTKRPERMREYMIRLPDGEDGLWPAACGLVGTERARTMPDVWPLPNLCLGVSCEDQPTADQRIPELLATPAAVRFVSAEPLLGAVDFATIDLPGGYEECAPLGLRWLGRLQAGAAEVERLDWIIVGGESGPGARPCRVEWVRSIVEQCRAAAVPCFVKQLGANVIGDWYGPIRHPKGGDPLEWPEDLRIREWPDA